MADHHDALAIKTRKAADDRLIIGKAPVAVQLLEIGKQVFDIIERIGSLRMTRYLRDLPGRELGIHIFGQRLAFLRQLLNFIRDIECDRIVMYAAQLLDFIFQIRDGTFKI